MNPDEARDLFSEAYDGTLTDDQRAAFDAALAGDAELRAEYEELTELLREAHDLGSIEGDTPNLLPGVQRKLRERSRGRFYRDRFALEKSFNWMPVVLALVMLGLMGLAWAGLHFVQELEAASQSTQ